MTKNNDLFRFITAILFYGIFFGDGFSFAENKPSFDCSKANSEIEKLICGNTELSSLDVELSEVYSKLQGSLDDKGKSDLKSSQIAWIKKRASFAYEGVLSADSFEDATKKKIENLKKNYGERIANVEAQLEKLPSKESEPPSSPAKVIERNETVKSGNETKTGIGRPKLIMEELYTAGDDFIRIDNTSTEENNDRKTWYKVLLNLGISDLTPPEDQSWSSDDCRYDTAILVLKQIQDELGDSSEYLKIWAKNQTRVFSGCVYNSEKIPPEEPKGDLLPKRAQSDYLYQLASWHFYGGQHEKALEIYQKLETMPDAQIRPYAAYMTIRTLASMNRVQEAYDKACAVVSDPSLKLVHRIAGNYRFIIMYYADRYENNLELTEKHLLWLLSLIRVTPGNSTNLKVSKADYHDAMEQLSEYFPEYHNYLSDWWKGNSNFESGSPRTQAVLILAPENELVDWMQSSRAYNIFDTDWLWALHEPNNVYWEQNRDIADHAWERWGKGDGGEWLQIASKRVHPKDDLAVEILKASEPFFSRDWKKETKEYKNWLFSLWENSVRIHLGRGETSEALALINNYSDFRGLCSSRWSEGNCYAASLSTVLRWLVYTGQTDSAREFLVMILKMYPDGFKEWRALLANSWEDLPLSYDNQFSSYPGSNRSTLWNQIINVLPSKVLYDLADNKNLSEAERALLVRTAFTRAIILGYDNDILEKYAILAAKLHPAIKEQILSSVANHDRNDCIDLLLRMPRFRPASNPERLNSWTVSSDEKAMQDMTAIDVYNHNDNNWWCRYDYKFFEGQILEAALILPNPGGDEIFKTTDRESGEFKPYIEKQKAFLAQHPYKKLIDMKEIASLEDVPAAPQFLTEAVISRESRFHWKFWQSDEIRNKHAANLHYAVRTTRYGCNNCGSHAVYSKKAYRILHKQYGKTTWAKATPYWFK